MKQQFSNVSAKYGAPMGRRSILDNPEATVTVFKMTMVDGDYDDGGAYWGAGPDNESIYVARGDGFEATTRAANAIQARANFAAEFPSLTIVNDDNEVVNAFVEGYLVCAAWADAPEGSNARFDNAAKAEALVVCQRFIVTCGPLFYEALELRDAEHLGHDFWLSRNGHGTGFWDRKELETNGIGDDLHKLAKKFGSVSLYAERGWLHFDL